MFFIFFPFSGQYFTYFCCYFVTRVLSNKISNKNINYET